VLIARNIDFGGARGCVLFLQQPQFFAAERVRPHPEAATAEIQAADLLATRIELFTKHIEAAYTVVYERYHAGLPPDHISVSGLGSLNISRSG